jgi:hypothetical protein
MKFVQYVRFLRKEEHEKITCVDKSEMYIHVENEVKTSVH